MDMTSYRWFKDIISDLLIIRIAPTYSLKILFRAQV